VVDDEPDILGSLAGLAELFLPDLEVLTAPSGEAALRLLRLRRVDAVLSDYKMPGMDGVELLREARQLAPQARLLLFSAISDQEGARRAGAGFIDGLVPKVLDPPQLVARLGDLLGTRVAPAA
jgi:response regulator RpfG family c-di-GMP phosphodiesterase